MQTEDLEDREKASFRKKSKKKSKISKGSVLINYERYLCDLN